MYLFPRYEDMEVPGKLKKARRLWIPAVVSWFQRVLSFQFLADLYSGKLHREFHYGPDKTEETTSDEPSTPEATDAPGDDQGDQDPSQNEVSYDICKKWRGFKKVKIQVDTGGDYDPGQPQGRDRREAEQPKKKKDPPPSQFQHLGPSKNRYTLLHDEF